MKLKIHEARKKNYSGLLLARFSHSLATGNSNRMLIDFPRDLNEGFFHKCDLNGWCVEMESFFIRHYEAEF